MNATTSITPNSRKSLSLGTKLTSILSITVAIILCLLTIVLTASTGKIMEQQSRQGVIDRSELLVGTMTIAEENFKETVKRFYNLFVGSYAGEFSLDPQNTVMVNEVETPVLKLQGEMVNNDNVIPDNFFNVTQSVATIFVKDGDDFVRISTSLKDKDGKRVLGTKLGVKHPAYELVLQGKEYTGLVELFGSNYMAIYGPLKNSAGEIIGLYFLGVDITQYTMFIKQQINSIKLGESGYFYVLDASNTAKRGNFVIHPNREGENALSLTDPNGFEFIKAMLDQKNGYLVYDYDDPVQKTLRPKLAAFNYLENRKWVVVGSIYVDEINAPIKEQQQHFILIGIASLLVIGLLMIFIIRRMITKPLNHITSETHKLADGDLTTHIHLDRFDEIGDLASSLNRIGENLSQVVGRVKHATDLVVDISEHMYQGNQTLLTQTQQQVFAVESTASALHEMMITVRQNTENAQNCDSIAAHATKIAEQSGQAVGVLVQDITQIHSSSQNIVSIVDVIDGIAFQTQILALNAAIEAARAGEQGRGFAVVAGEVGALAHRSSKAANEIKQMIEQIVSQIKNSSELAVTTGETMNSVLDSINQVSVAMADIVVASRQQNAGITQVNQSMEEIDASAAGNSKLVVENNNMTVTLKTQANELINQIKVFKID
ncbi:methyl-accepting chemotaxis protein [Thorsellia anophelis]|uniref:Methyl-accepting chemotaxis protein-2, aspartate sensor receptor n=1 Tax=Thorsellia anophelis DSM 18579 TaxID=1123402 RepID=A0A1I0E2M6_9GAMM|nr:methyl-accepting chemotaxis protein [Thorsellia anophelis]SET39170.1 methyl-accepting chemotaxis protein-2, aspartate sensor receptor [Thorsellia anophelis DSM 18579]